MEFGSFDFIVFFGFIAAVLIIGLWKSRNERTSEDYFLAGRGLKWWLIGFSLIAANISSEQLVGMSGNAASNVGLAIASYEWMAAIVLVVVAFWLLPYFLRAGIYTMPEFLEVRYNSAARVIMAIGTIFLYMVLLGSVTYSGALTISTMAAKMDPARDISVAQAAVVIGLIAMIYVTAGGLKACAWADLIQGSALIIGSAIVMLYAFKKLGSTDELAFIESVKTGAVGVKTFTQDTGAIDRFWELNKVRMNMFLPANDKVLPWTALILGLWIPNFYYWGLNQYITQRTLASSSLAQGQKGIVFSAFMKLLVPFVVVIPGIIAFNLYSKDMKAQAVNDNASVFALYKEANPETQIVEVVQDPNEQTLADWNHDKFMIAVFPSEEAMKAFSSSNTYILPITKEKYDSLIETLELLSIPGFRESIKRSAEQIKIKIGAAVPQDEEMSMELQGQDQVTGLPRPLTLTTSEVVEALEDPLDNVFEMIRQVLERTPPELASDIIDRGIALAGGGALLRGIDKLMTQKLGIPTYLVDNPVTCVAEGAVRGLEMYPILQRNLPKF